MRSMSWHAITMVVALSRSAAMSSSTWAAYLMLSEAVGSSSSSSAGRPAIALAMAMSWR